MNGQTAASALVSIPLISTGLASWPQVFIRKKPCLRPSTVPKQCIDATRTKGACTMEPGTAVQTLTRKVLSQKYFRKSLISASSKCSAVWLTVKVNVSDEWANCRDASSWRCSREKPGDRLPWKLNRHKSKPSSFTEATPHPALILQLRMENDPSKSLTHAITQACVNRSGSSHLYFST